MANAGRPAAASDRNMSAKSEETVAVFISHVPVTTARTGLSRQRGGLPLHLTYRLLAQSLLLAYGY
jgi:hypothetical protein